jgi:hypothetical protein
MPDLNPVVLVNEDNRPVQVPFKREVISCKGCGLVQFRAQTGRCRRCVQLLPRIELDQAIRPSGSPDSPRNGRQDDDKWLNLAMVENIGPRIQQFRQSRGLTQKSYASIAIVPGADRNQPDDAQSRHAREDFRGARHRFGPLLLPGDLRNGARRPIHSGAAALVRHWDDEQMDFVLKRLAAIGKYLKTARENSPGLSDPR